MKNPMRSEAEHKRSASYLQAKGITPLFNILTLFLMKKSHALLSAFSLLAVTLVAGCASTPKITPEAAEPAVNRPGSLYPQMYDVEIVAAPVIDVSKSPSANSSKPLPAGLAPVVPVEALTQETHKTLSVTAKVRMYYQIVSPISIKGAVYQRLTPDSPRVLLSEFEGNRVVSWVRPDYSRLEFDFAPTKAGESGTFKFVVSDRELVN